MKTNYVKKFNDMNENYKEKLTFEEIFQNDGLYKSDSFNAGFAFKIENGTLYSVQYKNSSDFNIDKENFPVYKELFKKQYTKVLNVNQLFK